MLVKDLIASLDKANNPGMKDFILQCQEVWNNDAAGGYLVKAMQLAGFSDTDIHRAYDKLEWAFDELSVDEAAEYDHRFYHGQMRRSEQSTGWEP